MRLCEERNMTKKTHAERTSAKALSRFAAVAAVLLTLCLVFMMPVGAEETGTARVDGNNIEISGTVLVSAVEWSKVSDKTQVTVVGKTADAALNLVNAMALDNYEITFKDLTLIGVNGNYKGFQHTKKVIYENCTIQNQIFEYASQAIFKNCTFVQTGNYYNIWTYGSNDISFINCDFKSDGKAILAYNEGTVGHTTVSIQDCRFTATTDRSKAAVEIDSSLNVEYNVFIVNSTYGDNFSGLVRHKKGEIASISIENMISYTSGDDTDKVSTKKVTYSYDKETAKAAPKDESNPFLVPGVQDGTDLPSCELDAPEGKLFEAWEIDGIKYLPGQKYFFLKDTTVKALWKDITYGLSATPTTVGFDSVKVGYTQPEAKEVTIKNNGNVAITLVAPTSDKYTFGGLPLDIPVGGEKVITIAPLVGLPVGNYVDTLKVTSDDGKASVEIPVSFLVYQPSSGGSSTTKPEEPVEPEIPVEPENPTEEPEAGEPSVETEVTDGGEVLFEEPVEPETPGADTPSDEPAEPIVTGVELPAGTDSEVAFIPVSEKPAPAGKEENTKKVFEINVPKYEKGKPATVKFTMTVAELAADGKTAADVALWHQDEETGEWTKLVTTFVIIDGVVYFEAITFDFSPFAIVYEDVSAPTEPETPEQPTESPAPILAVLAGLGAAVVLRRK